MMLLKFAVCVSASVSRHFMDDANLRCHLIQWRNYFSLSRHLFIYLCLFLGNNEHLYIFFYLWWERTKAFKRKHERKGGGRRGHSIFNTESRPPEFSPKAAELEENPVERFRGSLAGDFGGQPVAVARLTLTSDPFSTIIEMRHIAKKIKK